MEALNGFVLHIMDFLLGWMLYLPQDVALVIVALGTSVILTFVRPFTTKQDLLRRCKRDKKRLKVLIRQAKKRKDAEAVKRCRATSGMIAMETMKAEGLPLLVAVLPIAALAVWAFARIGYVPPQPGKPVEVRAWTRASAVDKAAWLVPQSGLQSDRWMQRIVEAPDGDKDAGLNGYARWTVVPAKNAKPYALQVRCAGRTLTKELLVDGEHYAPPIEVYADAPVHTIQIGLTPYKPFGFVPALWENVLDGWLVGYLLIAIPFVFLLRWITGIC